MPAQRLPDVVGAVVDRRVESQFVGEQRALLRPTVVGGHIRTGEPPARGARHEPEEESGVGTSALRQAFRGLVRHHSPGGIERITVVFVTHFWTGRQRNAEPDRREGLFWVSMEKPPPDCLHRRHLPDAHRQPLAQGAEPVPQGGAQ
ncbi:NUDIX domain-containing protein [Streptomyces sp. NPDC002742]|uniref:NUDIX domain-containing protein n=1 Tax=Streptomyces sp. NPDC002742 TaxID=3364663 RepID=UPI0036753C32